MERLRTTPVPQQRAPELSVIVQAVRTAGSKRFDVVRQVATVAGALGQLILPTLILPRLRRDLSVPDVAQPAPYAFAAWLPIYATTLAYAGFQARSSRREVPLLRDIGVPLAVSMLSTTSWAPLLREQNYWGAQAALIGTAVFAEQARGRLASATSASGLDDSQRARLAVPVGLQAGWGAAAAAVNLAAMLVDRGPTGIRQAPTATGVVTVATLGALAAARIRSSPPARSTAYASTVVWALAGVATGQARSRPKVALAAVAAVLPVVAAVRFRR